MANWKEVDPEDGTGTWKEIDSDEVDLTSIERKPTDVNALWEGALQGGSFGFSDEAQALLSSIFTDKKYRDRWNELQKDIELARTTSPKMFYAGQIGGGIASSFLPGIGAIGNLGKAAQYTKLAADLSKMTKLKGYLSQAANIAKIGAKAGAIQGGISGLGQGGELGMNSITDVGLGGLVGSLSGGVVSPIATAASQAIVPAINLAKEKVIQPILKNPYMASLSKILPEYTKEAMENLPTYIKPQQSVLEVGRDFEGKLNKFSQDLNIEKDAARSLLSDVPTIPVEKVVKAVKDSLLDKNALFVKKELQKIPPPAGTQGPTMQKIRKSLDSTKGVMPIYTKQASLLKSMALEQGGKLSEKQVRTFLDSDIKGLTEWVSASGGSQKPVAAAYNKVYGVLNDDFLNPHYKKAMEPVIEKTREVSNLANAFKFVSQHGKPTFDDAGNFVVNRHSLTDPTLSKLRGLPTKEVAAEILRDFSNKYPDTDIGAMARRAFIEKGLTPKRASFGTLAAMAVNPLKAGPLGVIRDVAGPPIWRAMAVRSTPATTPGADFFAGMVAKPMSRLFADPNLYGTQEENLYKP